MSDPSARGYWATFINVFISAVYVYDDHLRIVCNFTGEGEAVNYDFVNDIESNEEAVEVFDFDAHASTIGGVNEHPALYVCSTMFVLLLPLSAVR